MKGSKHFLTFTSVDAQFGSQTVISVPLSQVREIKEYDFSTAVVGNDHLRPVKSGIMMAGKDGPFYWATEARGKLVAQIDGQ